jgi:DNA-binding CsgD family transcriptional regulator/PAS domain-containing protein
MRHVSAEAFSTLVGSIYDCALDPARWHDTVTDLCRWLEFRTGALALQEMPSGHVLLDVTTGVYADDIERMRTYGPDVIERWGGPAVMATMPLDEPLVLSRVNPRHTECRYSREWSRPLGFIDTLAIGFFRDPGSVSSLSLCRHVDDGPIGDEEIDVARLFVPHLKRALTISRLLDARAVERASFAAVLDGLSVAVLLVGRDLRLMHANRAGETLLRTGDPLGLRAGRVTAPAALAAALDAALAAPLDGIGRRGLGIPARRSDGEELVLHLLPLADASPLPGAAAALFVAPATQPHPAPLAAIAALFDLTPAEARVLERIAAGRTEAETAAALGVAPSTVHTHLLRLFDKTRTRRQADLVALVASFTLPIA